MDKKDCAGCEQDFYNHGGVDGSTKECWLLKGKGHRIRKMYRIPMNIPMNQREAYEEVRVPDCYRRKGYGYYATIPTYAKTAEQRKAECD